MRSRGHSLEFFIYLFLKEGRVHKREHEGHRGNFGCKRKGPFVFQC